MVKRQSNIPNISGWDLLKLQSLLSYSLGRRGAQEPRRLKLSRTFVVMGTPQILCSHLSLSLSPEIKSGTSAQIELQSMGRCLDIEEARTNDGANVQLFTCLKQVNDHQSWDYSTKGTLMSRLHGKCLDAVQSTDDGSNVQVWSCSGAKNQKWAFTPEGQIVSIYNRKCLQAAGTGDRANIRLWKCDASDPLQLFTIRGGVDPAAAPTTKTVGGCTCKDSWSLNGVSYVYPNNCAPANNMESKPWCFTKQDGPPCIGSSGQVEWDFCDSTPPPPPPSSSFTSPVRSTPTSANSKTSSDGATVVRRVDGSSASDSNAAPSESSIVMTQAIKERESFRGSGMARAAQRSEMRQVEEAQKRTNSDGSISRTVGVSSSATAPLATPSNPIHVDNIVSCVFGKSGPNGCICNEGFKLPYCDDCVDHYFGFPKCQKKKWCHHNRDHDHFHCKRRGTCDHSTGQCLCHVNFAGSHCQDCASGFTGPKCTVTTSAGIGGDGDGGGSSLYFFLCVGFAGAIYYFGKERRYF
eukprot:g282.t1